jgi:hypothetical protein
MEAIDLAYQMVPQIKSSKFRVNAPRIGIHYIGKDHRHEE